MLSSLGLATFYTPLIGERSLRERYTLRRLDLHRLHPPKERSDTSFIPYPGPKTGSRGDPDPEGHALNPAMPTRVPQLAPRLQTLVQPKVILDLTPDQESPVPNVLIWMPEKDWVSKIVPPPLQKPSAANVLPSLAAPNRETESADFNSSSSNLAPTRAIHPNATFPLVVRGAEENRTAPVTTSPSPLQPTPAAVLSLTDLHMPDGTVTLPSMNQTARSDSPMAVTGGQLGKGSLAGTRDPSHEDSTSDGPGSVSNADSRDGDKPSTHRITLPRDGQFGVVIVGSSLQEKYPQTAELWSGRLAYMVYLHVGLAKSWILQYSLPRAADAAVAGTSSRIEAPWPFDIVLPNIPADPLNAEALFVHGFVNQDGRFEALDIFFPPSFEQAQFTLAALQQWQFRPAKQNGHAAAVEVLLIIPEKE